MNDEQQPQAKASLEEPRREDSYFEKLIKYIPLDIIAGYQAIDGIIRDQATNPLWLYWTAFVGLLVLTPFYTMYRPNQPPTLMHAKTRFTVVTSTIAYVVWVYAIGGPFAVTFPDFYRPVYGSVLLILTTLALPVLEQMVIGNNNKLKP